MIFDEFWMKINQKKSTRRYVASVHYAQRSHLVIEIEAHKEEAAASGCWFAAVLSAAATSEPVDNIHFHCR